MRRLDETSFEVATNRRWREYSAVIMSPQFQLLKNRTIMRRSPLLHENENKWHKFVSLKNVSCENE